MATAMAIDLKRLLDKAFFVEDVQNATEAIERARRKYVETTETAGMSFEVVAPPEPHETWVRERLLRPLVYFCESEGSPIPRCSAVFVSLFVGARLYCLTVGEVMEWAHQQLGLSPERLRDEYGTHEQDTALR